MTEGEWRKLEKQYTIGPLTIDELLIITKDEDCHPEWWDHPCDCRECRSCG